MNSSREIGDEKWIHYDNPKRKKLYVKPCQPAKSMAKPNIHGAKVMLCILWDQKGVLYYELLKLFETINGERYWTQLIRLKRAIAEKRPEYATRHEAIIFIMTTLGPMLLFRLRTIWKTVDRKFYPTCLIAQTLPLLTTIWLDSFLAAKPEQFFWNGIHKLPERWEKLRALDGQYFK